MTLTLKQIKENKRKNAEKQRKYRQKHLKVECDKARLQCNLETGIKYNLDRLAYYYGCTITEVLESLIKAESTKVLRRLSGEDQCLFYDMKLQRNQKESE